MGGNGQLVFRAKRPSVGVKRAERSEAGFRRGLVRFVFILPVVGDARQSLRIKLLKREGVREDIFAFRRAYYDSSLESARLKVLGTLRHGRYLRRMFAYLTAIGTIRRGVREADAVYVYGLDLAVLAWISSRMLRPGPKLVLELLDIRGILTKRGILPSMARALQGFIIPRVDMLIVPTEAFVSEYLRKVVGVKVRRWMVIENKLDADSIPERTTERGRSGQVRKDGSIKIGYFGLLRCDRSLDVLMSLAARGGGDYTIDLRGFIMTPGYSEETLRERNYVTYGGPYKGDSELPELYNRVDMVWACYPFGEGRVGNWIWARTNRFYASCFFMKPIIAAEGSADAVEVTRWGIGAVVDLSDTAGCVRQLMGITRQDIRRWHRNLRKVPRDRYLYGSEHKELIKQICTAPHVGVSH